MSHPLRSELAGALYHVTVRGNTYEAIFLDDLDRQTFLASLSRVYERFEWHLWAYCQMDNHYQLPIETPEPTRCNDQSHRQKDYAVQHAMNSALWAR